MVEWIDLDELLDKNIGDIREMLAHEDSDISFRTFLIENGWIVDSDNEYDDDDYDDDEVEEEESDVEAGSEALPSEEEEELAESIADDIIDDKYTIDSLVGIYADEIIARVRYLSE